MNVVALLTVAVVVGWIAILILHDEVSLPDFAIAIAGAALAGLLGSSLGISPTGDYGLLLPGTLLCWGGAMTLLALINLLRYGRPRRTREQSR
jgi:uncharacterized membrane protein YeaQ/YmgE (transglycosylase-associated protein family)